MNPNPTTTRCSLSECHTYDISHRKSLVRKDITLAVCEHLKIFQPERWKARENWSFKAKRPPEANKANAAFNRQLRQFQKAMDKGDLKSIVRLASANPKLLA